MKKLYFIIATLMMLMVQVSTAQTQLWGLAELGGTIDSGTVIVADGNGNHLHSVYSCHGATVALPIGGLCLAPNNKLYGVTLFGRCHDYGGVCFNFDPSTGVWTNFRDFYCDSAHGWAAGSGMMLASDGNLYGMCSTGGYYGHGVIYKVDPNTDTYTDIYDFIDSTGDSPYGTLAQLSDGKLYGMTYGGGTGGYGTIFCFNPVTFTYTILHSFNYPGGNPFYGNLLNASNGKLYGMTIQGGTHNYGVIFSYEVASHTYAVVHNFVDSSGYNPEGSLIQATDGKLYGMASTGGANVFYQYGVIFSYDITSNTYTDILNFIGSNGSGPTRSLIQASNGLLYGATIYGGTNNLGVFFSYNITTSTYTVLTNMDSTIGINPNCDFIETPLIGAIQAIKHIDNSITIYPNPFTSATTITFSEEQKNILIKVYDVLGQIVNSEKAIGNSAVLDMSGFSKGIYFVRIEDEKKNVVNRKIVVQ